MSALDAGLLRRSLAAEARALVDDLELFDSIASTNTHLLEKAPPPPGRLLVAMADHQTAGRGRRARRWQSPPGAGLCLSLAYTFAERPRELPALTLVIGVAVLDALEAAGFEGIGLKWPNDIVARDRKLGGVLTEMQSGGQPDVTVVTGIGLNVRLEEPLDIDLDPSWARAPIALSELAPEHPPREVLAAAIIGRLAAHVPVFAGAGFAPFAEAWHAADWLAGKRVRVSGPEREITGKARGVDDSGALRVDTGSGEVCIVSGSVALATGEEEPA